ncbi:MAG TPA: pyridoxal-phosphate dependent enzyme [Steroidobacteraceae bacterium]|jgi:threonine dehydratase|nr:pyridoxal-phosphate dependent enzyme [Steroidobacteraceae bacterium]
MADTPAHLTWDLIVEARARISGKVNLTPVLTSTSLDAQSGARLYFKCENFQKCGAFKARGATNAVFALSAEAARRGVATHSSGNHAAALTRAARLRGVPAYIVMPDNTPQAKRDAVARYGGSGVQISWCEPTLAARERAARELIAATGAVLVHPYDDLAVMAGQATAGVELLDAVPDLDVILCPVGGGGLLGGTAVAARTLKPTIRVIGVEPAGADDAARSLRAGRILPSVNPDTIADGLRGALGERPFAAIRAHVDDIVTVPEAAIVAAMRQLWEVMKIVIEPSGAVPYAAITARVLNLAGQRVGLVLTGGNLDLDRLPWMSGIGHAS